MKTARTLLLLAAALAAMPLATLKHSFAEDVMVPKIVEIVSFKLVSGVNQDQFLAAASATNGFLKIRKGFISRKLVVGKDGQYTDIAFWASLGDAETAMADSMKAPSLLPFINAIDPASMKIDHQAVILSSD